MNPHRTSAPRRNVAGVAVLGAIALAACGDDRDAKVQSHRQAITFTANDTSLTVPPEVPAGFVDIKLASDPAGTIGHHVFIARLNDGVVLDEALESDDGFFTMMTVEGGNGTIAAGMVTPVSVGS